MHGWRCARAVYGGLGGRRWTWARIRSDPEAFRKWLAANQAVFCPGGPNSGVGNHRKYQSLSGTSARGTGAAFVSYVKWVNPPRTHAALIQDGINAVGTDPGTLFAHLYNSMASVASFGRTGRFDFLTMLGKLGLAPIAPASPYLDGSSGPLRGARLLFLGNSSATGRTVRELDTLRFFNLEWPWAVGCRRWRILCAIGKKALVYFGRTEGEAPTHSLIYPAKPVLQRIQLIGPKDLVMLKLPDNNTA